ncbi:hypothetical protein CDD83_5282 [Cordyceps sp. RAO-2017]|nr:hypothetical protein CDD83_5282 [Cordyceps sp. RAO-2017]
MTTRCLPQTLVVGVRKLALERDVIVSVLESTATRREAKGYLQKYAKKKPLSKLEQDATQLVPRTQLRDDVLSDKEPINVAIVKLRAPQLLTYNVISGIANTLLQLRVLGLLAIVVVDCGVNASRQVFEREAFRLCEAIDSILGHQGARVAGNLFAARHSQRNDVPTAIFSRSMCVDDAGLLDRALQHGMIVIAPSLTRRDDLSTPQPAGAHETILTLLKYLSGMQFEILNHGDTYPGLPRKIASVERLILLDPLGGIPLPGRPSLRHRFINLEQEFGQLRHHMQASRPTPMTQAEAVTKPGTIHAENLKLVKDGLSLLPPSSSALITTPVAAANSRPLSPSSSAPTIGRKPFNLTEMVTTRKHRNPLLHNLLTDRPVSSPSLPLQRIRGGDASGDLRLEDLHATTLVKRGLPVTIYPDPKFTAWQPPKPDSPRLRLTDICIDLPRLVRLIEDSFHRKLDVQAYIDRVNDNLAGIIIAGEYEGCAILTWEPVSFAYKPANRAARFVPYLDKFAVMRNHQGSGGVADIVFNAMVQDCLPEGVCWRSRNENPVNKWYFERSTGTSKLSKSNWTMFWTTLGLGHKNSKLRDYEWVCRNIPASWADF